MADTKISALTALDQSTADPAKTYVPLFHEDGSPLNRRMNFTNLRVGSFLHAGASGSAARFSSAGNGVAVLTNDAGNDLSRVCFGGTTSLFPALKRSGAALHLRLADDSAFANLQLANLEAATMGNTSISVAWSGTGVATTPLLVNVTADPGPANTASELFRLNFIGVHRFSVDKVGNAAAAQGVYAAGNAYFRGGSLLLGASEDAVLTRDAADRLALRRSTNAQRLAVYRTWSAADNFERGVMSWYDSSTNDGVAGTVFRIGTEKGTVGGTARAVSIVTDGTERIGFGASGHTYLPGGQTLSFNGSATADPLIYGNVGQLCLRATSADGVQLQGTSGADGGRLNFKGHASIVSASGAILGITNGSTGPGKLAIDNVQGTNFERLKMEWDTNVARIGTSKGGSGTARDFAIITDNAVRVTFAAAGGQTAADGHHMAFGTSTGTKIGTATGQKIGFWNATPVVQQVLATGAGATVDNVITLLQTLGLCKQS